MRYGEIVRGVFISRPNRFIAEADIGGETHTVHVKNTGRCRELLIKGTEVILEKAPEGAQRKTAYDLIAVYKNGMLINMDSQSPNKAAAEFIPKLFDDVTLIRPETVYGGSRFDFYIEAGEGENIRRIFMEVKGCTLEDNGICRFPDAPTERGVKHLRELERAVSEGYEGYIFFVIQMDKAKYFTPNADTHPQFAEALRSAAAKGVKVLAYTCDVKENEMTINKPCKVFL